MKKILIPLGVTLAVVILSFLLFGGLEAFSHDLLISIGNHRPLYALASFAVLVSDILLPVPSSIVIYLNGLFLGVISGFLLSLVSVLCSSLIGYFIGRGSSAALRSGPDQVSENILRKYGYLAILITRGIPVLSESICIVCGYNRYSLKQYMLLNLIGYVPVCFVYAYAGSVSGSKEQFLASFGASILIAGLLWVFGRKLIDRGTAREIAS